MCDVCYLQKNTLYLQLFNIFFNMNDSSVYLGFFLNISSRLPGRMLCQIGSETRRCICSRIKSSSRLLKQWIRNTSRTPCSLCSNPFSCKLNSITRQKNSEIGQQILWQVIKLQLYPIIYSNFGFQEIYESWSNGRYNRIFYLEIFETSFWTPPKLGLVL